MAANETTPIMSTSQVTTSFNGPPTVADATVGDVLSGPHGPGIPGTLPGDTTPANPALGEGIEGEEVVWEAQYAMKNFAGRLTIRTLLTVGWIALAVATWGYDYGNLAVLTVIVGLILGVSWVALIYRILQARFGHHYRLTTRRLFISTGLMRRRRDMMELLKVKDVFTKQTLFERWLSLGTVVVVSSDHDLPTFYITGVDDPKRVMDLVWHHARAERDRRSVKVEQV